MVEPICRRTIAQLNRSRDSFQFFPQTYRWLVLLATWGMVDRWNSLCFDFLFYLIFFFFLWTYVLSWGHWHPSFGLLVTFTLGIWRESGFLACTLSYLFYLWYFILCNFFFCSCVLAFLTICHITEAQFAIGFSPSAPVGRNHLSMAPNRAEQGQSTCIDWRNPTSVDKLMAPYAQRMCNQWSPLGNGNGAANVVPGFGYTGYAPYNGGGFGYSGGFGSPYRGGSVGGFGNPYGAGFGAPVVGYNPFRPF